MFGALKGGFQEFHLTVFVVFSKHWNFVCVLKDGGSKQIASFKKNETGG